MSASSLKGGKKASSFLLLFVIISAAVILSAVSLLYFQTVSQQIDKTVRDDLRRQSRIEAFQVAELLEAKIQMVATSVRTASEEPAVKNDELPRGGDVINARQHGTEEMTDRYFWLDANGKNVWSSAFEGNMTEYQRFKGFDASDRPYFVNSAKTNSPYFSPVIMGLDNSQRMFISYPILVDNMFRGIVGASIRADTLGSLVKSQLSPELHSTVGIIDPNGTIIYSEEHSLIGDNIFGQKVQSALQIAFSSKSQLDDFNAFLKASTQGGKDSRDFIGRNGSSATVNYMPILIGKQPGAGEKHFLTLYLLAPHDVAGTVGPLVDQQRNFSIAVVVTIAGIAIVLSYFILSSNKRLEKIVADRTASLKNANESLSKSNKELAEKTQALEVANEKLKINDNMQREFINIAAHELRTPTQAIIGYTELFDMRPNENNEESIKAIARNALRLERLTQDLLDVSKIEGKKLELHKEKFNISEVISTYLEDAKRQLLNGAVKLVYQEPRDIIIEADKARISQVLSNLIINAIKFTKNGTIFVLAEKSEGFLKVSVVDSGSGIDPNIQSKLFTKFTSKSQTGTGLGLFISKSIVEAHGGTIAARNNDDGKGSTFSFTLPL